MKGQPPTMPDFTPKYNWPEVMKEAVKLRAEGLNVSAIAKRLNVARTALGTKLSRIDKLSTPGQPAQAQASEGQRNLASPSFSPSATLDDSRTAARRLLHDALTGAVDPTAQQVAAARLVLRDELEPSEERNPYAAFPEDELAERVLTLAASVLGVARCTEILSDLAKAGTADVLQGGEPDLTIATPKATLAPASPTTLGLVEDIATTQPTTTA